MFSRLKKTWSAGNGSNVIDMGGPSRMEKEAKGMCNWIFGRLKDVSAWVLQTYIIRQRAALLQFFSRQFQLPRAGSFTGTNNITIIDDTNVAVTILHRRNNSVLSKEYHCDAGKITKVTNFMGIIRFKSDDENGHFDECLFFLSSYKVKRIRTLCQIFTTGDWVAFAALKLGRGHWTALDVRHRSEVMKCYGQFKRSLPIDQLGQIDYAIRPQIRAPLGGGDVTISKWAFRESGQKSFDQLRDGEWLRFLALEKPDQIPRGDFTAAAVEAEIPSILGLIVKRTKETVEVWCMEVGLAMGRVDEESSLTVGHWIRFRLGAQDAVTDGCWEAFDIVSTSSPPDVLVKVGRYIRVTALATAGVLVPRFGTVWNEKLGRMSVGA